MGKKRRVCSLTSVLTSSSKNITSLHKESNSRKTEMLPPPPPMHRKVERAGFPASQRASHQVRLCRLAQPGEQSIGDGECALLALSPGDLETVTTTAGIWPGSHRRPNLDHFPLGTAQPRSQDSL